MSKNILIFSDGTGQAGGMRPDQLLSNVYKLYRATRISPDNDINPNEQVAFYDVGLGTDASSTGLTHISKQIRKFLGSVTGRGITNNITECYEAILNLYEPGDRIFLFGFSRGAYTVRCVANLMALCGIPTTDGKGKALPRFHKDTKVIAKEAVTKVYEHGAGLKRGKFQAERLEQAKRFRNKYKSDIDGDANVAPYFVGVFDTVAALGVKGLLRVFMTLSALFLTVVFTSLSSWALAKLFSWDFWSIFIAISSLIFVLGLYKSFESSFRFIGHYPKKWQFRFHFAKWKMKNYDRGLDKDVKFTRHALAIDETRKDFDRVEWGNKNTDYTRKEEGLDGFIQLWFPGNHSDIGGSYPENESRLSDIALKWMVDEATNVPHPLIVNTDKLNLFPAADGIQHCEVDRIRQLYPNWIPKKLRLTWPEKHRYAASGAPYHLSVKERLYLSTVIKQGQRTSYRPKALKYDEKLASLYSEE